MDILLQAQQAHEQGNSSLAMQLFKQALSMYPKEANVFYAFGQFLIQIKQLPVAEKMLAMACKINPDNLQGLYIRAHFELENNNLDAAIQLHQQACKVFPNKPADATFVFGALLNNYGHKKEAISIFNEILAQEPFHHNATHDLAFESYMAFDDKNTAISVLEHITEQGKQAVEHINFLASIYFYESMWPALEALVNNKTLSEQEQRCVHTYWALKQWLDGALTELPLALKQLPKYATQDEFNKTKICGVFQKMLMDILKEDKQENIERGRNGAPIYMVGESHTLFAANMQLKDRYIHSNLAIGTKAFHITKENSFLKRLFEEKLKQTPNDSTVIVTVGEIDCRHDEGFITYFNKHPETDKTAYIKKAAEDYVNQVMKWLDGKNMNVYFWGIPAPRPQLDKATQEIWDLVKETSCTFNDAIKDAAQQHGTKFIDVYTETSNEDGFAKDNVHIDFHHLKPTVYLNLLKQL